MPNRIFSGPDNELSILRQLKILVVVLIISNIALGVFDFYFVRAVDWKYSRLIDRAVPTLNELQKLTGASVNAMHSTNPALFVESAQTRAAMSQRARAALEHDRDLRSRALKHEWLANNADERMNFKNAGETFSQAALSVLNLLELGNDAEANRQREELLRPAFDRYIAATTKAADNIHAQSLRTSDTLTVRTDRVSNMMLGLASWPVVIVGALLLITAIFVIVVLLRVFLFKPEVT